MKTLIVDCGATHCRYALIENKTMILRGKTAGFSPIAQSMEHIPIIPLNDTIPSEVHFFCTGLTSFFTGQAQKVWLNRYPEARIFVHSDLVAAALASCGNSKGYVHIMGTGSAVNFWDGSKMQNPKINLGYIWEDYASGFDIGKRIIQLWLENQLSPEEAASFQNQLGKKENFVANVYSSDNIKALLAQASPLLKQLHQERQKNIINERLSMYFTKNIDIFADTNQHHFVGSLAFFMKNQIEEKMHLSGKNMGKIMANTMDELCNYYMK